MGRIGHAHPYYMSSYTHEVVFTGVLAASHAGAREVNWAAAGAGFALLALWILLVALQVRRHLRRRAVSARAAASASDDEPVLPIAPAEDPT